MQPLSRYSYLVCAAFIVGSAFFYYPKWKQAQTEATLSWDVAGYYLYLPAALIYGDLKAMAFGDSLLQKYRPAPEWGTFQHPSGHRVIKYASGQAWQFLPWFLAGHAYAHLAGYPADGFSYPYQFAISMGSLLVALLGLWLLRRLLLRFFSDGATAATLLLIVLGTNYFEYSAFHGALTHNWLFTLYTILLLTTIRFYEKPTYTLAALLGVLVGWAALTRPTDIVAALIPLGWGVYSLATTRERLALWRLHAGKLGLAVALTALVGFIQFAYWKYVTGEWVVYSYQDQGFSWLRPHLLNGIFSYRAGWLVYTPMMGFAVAGLYFLARQHRSIFPLVPVFFGVYLYITFAWDIWWYGGSLGQRAMVQSYPVLAFPLAALLQAVSNWKKAGQVAFWAVAGVFIWYNLWLTHQAHRGGLLRAGDMTKAYFWKILGKSEVEPEAQKLLDSKDEVQGAREQIKVLYANDFEADTLKCPLPPVTGSNSLWLDAAHQSSPVFNIPLPNGEAQWIRASASFHCDQKEWDVWKMTQMVLRFSNHDAKVKENMIRIYRILDAGQTRLIYLDAKVPRKAYNKIELFFWNAGSDKPLVIDDLRVESFMEN